MLTKTGKRRIWDRPSRKEEVYSEDSLRFVTQAVRWHNMTRKAAKRALRLCVRFSVLRPPTLGGSVSKALGSHCQGGEFKSRRGTEVFLHGSLSVHCFLVSVFCYSRLLWADVAEILENRAIKQILR